MKKINIFGKSISVFALALIAMAGIGSAVLVSYLSNQVEADVTVDSPMEQWIWDGSDWIQPSISASIYGGETISFSVKTKNHANTAITGNAKNIVSNPSGLTCEDFSLVRAKTRPPSGQDQWYDITSTCTEIDAYHVEFAYGPTPIIWAAGQEDITDIEATFKPNAFGTYTYTSQIVPA